jgi:hypothetical protein
LLREYNWVEVREREGKEGEGEERRGEERRGEERRGGERRREEGRREEGEEPTHLNIIGGSNDVSSPRTSFQKRHVPENFIFQSFHFDFGSCSAFHFGFRYGTFS